MYLLGIFALFAILPSALAGPGDVPFGLVAQQLHEIDEACVNLDKTIAAWSGSYLGGVAIIKQSSKLVNTITGASANFPSATHKLANETNTEQDVFDAAQRLATSVRQTVDAVIAAKTKVAMTSVLGNPNGIKILESILSATEDTGAVLLDNTTPERKKEAQEILGLIETQLKRGVAAYR